jgi:Fe-Mn family superoxide dismutase
MAFELPSLSYDYKALEPVIDAMTVEIHYSKHHATYLKNLNSFLEKQPALFDLGLEKILADLNQVPEEIRTAVRNNGGGVYNHNVYWAVMSPHKSEPKGKLKSAIDTSFGSLDSLKQEVEKAGLGRFGSGWSWLSKKADGSLVVHSTPNQDTPLAEGLYPLLGVDVWEHAYYLKYQNRRADYLSSWWNVANWDEIERRFLDGKLPK